MKVKIIRMKATIKKIRSKYTEWVLKEENQSIEIEQILKIYNSRKKKFLKPEDLKWNTERVHLVPGKSTQNNQYQDILVKVMDFKKEKHLWTWGKKTLVIYKVDLVREFNKATGYKIKIQRSICTSRY